MANVNIENLTPTEKKFLEKATATPELTARQKLRAENLGKNIMKEKIPTVPTKVQTIYNENDIINLSMGKPNYLSVMAKKYRERPSRISTGIRELDLVSGGGWSSGLSVIAAAPNIGKTTILIQSACAMAQQGTAVVFITNDMRKEDLEAKVISQLSYQMRGEGCLRLSEITNGDKLSFADSHNEELSEALERTMKYLHIRDLIYDEDFDRFCGLQDGIDNKTRLQKIFEVYSSVYEKVIFIVDSLQQVAAYIDTGKNGVDTMLRIFKEFSATVPIVMVSTLNRNGYSKGGVREINMTDLKETGSLEYNTDLLLTMVPFGFGDEDNRENLKEFKSKDYRDVVITCKKSRDSKEMDMRMTLYAPGCTFIPFEEPKEETKQHKKGEKKSADNVAVPPASSMSWEFVM